MKKVALSLIISCFMAQVVMAATQVTNSTFTIPQGVKKIGHIDFSQYPVGTWYTFDRMSREWNSRIKNGDSFIDSKGIIHNRAIIVQNDSFKSKALRVLLPGQKILPLDTGIQIFSDIGGYESVYFGNSMYLPPDFECGKEIKIPPGICGGWKIGSGGDHPDGVRIGPWIRAVIQNCQAKSYIYHLNQIGDNGDGGFPGSPTNGDKYAWKLPNGNPVFITKGERHDIMFFVAMNTPGQKNGIHKVWFDGILVLSLNNLEFRRVKTLQFDTLSVDLFRGGGDMSYSTPNSNTLDIGNFTIYVK
jgi:hypothetical protein